MKLFLLSVLEALEFGWQAIRYALIFVSAFRHSWLFSRTCFMPLDFCTKSVDENIKLIAERQMFCISDLSRIERAMRRNLKAKPSIPGAPCGVEFANNLVGMIKAKGFHYRT